MGRQRHKKVRVSEIRRLSELQVTEREAAAFFDMRLATFKELLRIDVAARDAWEQGREKGKVALRRKQMRLADTSAPMAIFLGKQYLGQQDVIVTEHSGRDGGPITTMDLGKLNADERKDLRRLLTRARKDGSG